MTDRELLEQALEAMLAKQQVTMWTQDDDRTKFNRAITDIRERLAQPEQDPVAWYEFNADVDAWFLAYSCNPNAKTRPLYTAPQPAQKPLTEEMITAAARELCKIHAGECQIDEQDTWKFYSHQFKRDAQAAIEAAHGIVENK